MTNTNDPDINRRNFLKQAAGEIATKVGAVSIFAALGAAEFGVLKREAAKNRQAAIEDMRGGIEFTYEGSRYVFSKQVAELSADDVQNPEKLKQACGIKEYGTSLVGRYLKDNESMLIHANDLPSKLLEKLHEAMKGPQAHEFTPKLPETRTR